MINTNKQILLDLYKDGVLCFDSNLDKVYNSLKHILSCTQAEFIDGIVEAFNENYIVTYDNLLEEGNLKGEPIKLLSLNIVKIFEDELFINDKDYNDLLILFNKDKESLINMSKASLFLSEISACGYDEIATKIFNCTDKINSCLYSNLECLLPIQYQIFLDSYNSLMNTIDELPDKYKYAKQFFHFKNYYNLAQNVNTNIFKVISRNDKCPCGSGLKFKKCCLR